MIGASPYISKSSDSSFNNDYPKTEVSHDEINQATAGQSLDDKLQQGDPSPLLLAEGSPPISKSSDSSPSESSSSMIEVSECISKSSDSSFSSDSYPKTEVSHDEIHLPTAAQALDGELPQGHPSHLLITEGSSCISKSSDNSLTLIENIPSISNYCDNSFSPQIDSLRDETYLPITPQEDASPLLVVEVNPQISPSSDNSSSITEVSPSIPISNDSSSSPKTEVSQNESDLSTALQTPLLSPPMLQNSLSTEAATSPAGLKYDKFHGWLKEDHEAWLSSFECITGANHEAAYKAQIFGGLMKDIARKWYSTLSQSTKTDWIELKRRFLKDFTEMFPRGDVLTEIEHIRFKKHERVTHFLWRLRTLTCKLNPPVPEQLVFYWFIVKLPQEVRKYVLQEAPTSLRKAAELAQEELNELKVEKEVRQEEKKKKKRASKKHEKRIDEGSNSSSSTCSSDSTSEAYSSDMDMLEESMQRLSAAAYSMMSELYVYMAMNEQPRKPLPFMGPVKYIHCKENVHFQHPYPTSTSFNIHGIPYMRSIRPVHCRENAHYARFQHQSPTPTSLNNGIPSMKPIRHVPCTENAHFRHQCTPTFSNDGIRVNYRPLHYRNYYV
ncbi:unnamed protein product [Calypogeia fissa]